jgi:uncharacterized protein YgiM (DUF1202 family)
MYPAFPLIFILFFFLRLKKLFFKNQYTLLLLLTMPFYSVFTIDASEIKKISKKSIITNVYVLDQKKIWTRAGPSSEYRIRYTVLPGTALKVLLRNETTGYTQVKDQKNRKFWIKNRYLTSTPPKHFLLEKSLKDLQITKKKKH